ncbi:MCP four helix bundle domain-containing protein, partial [Lysobacter sp. 2RAB21]
MSNLTIRQRIMLSFAVIIAVMLLMGGIALQRLNHIQAEESRLRSDSIPGLYASGQIETQWHSYNTALNGLASPNAKDRAQAAERMRARREAFDDAMNRYRVTINDPGDRRNFDSLTSMSTQVFALQPELIKL